MVSKHLISSSHGLVGGNVGIIAGTNVGGFVSQIIPNTNRLLGVSMSGGIGRVPNLYRGLVICPSKKSQITGCTLGILIETPTYQNPRRPNGYLFLCSPPQISSLHCIFVIYYIHMNNTMHQFKSRD